MEEEVAVFDHGQFKIEDVSIDGANITVKEIKINQDAIVTYVNVNLDMEEVFDNEDIKKYVMNSWRPEEIYFDDELGIWAKENGFIMAGE